MANRTAKDAHTIKGTNPQYLVEKIIRTRIYDSLYWKEHCFALTAELVIDKGIELRYIGGVYAGNVKPTPFLCLTLKLLQLQPDKDVVLEFLKQTDYKYLRALAALYIRLTFNSVEIFTFLEPLYGDYRKLRYMNRNGQFELVYMDEFIDHLLRDESYCDIQLPRLQKRQALEESDQIDTYVSSLDEDLDNLSESESEEEPEEKPKRLTKRRNRSRSRSTSREREKDRRRGEEEGRERRRRHDSPEYSRRDRDNAREKEREREKERKEKKEKKNKSKDDEER
ncbi:UNVERIFIED_CONTAM: Pre-mRNA-splicing factor 38A, partial [Eudyptes robustus]